MQASASAFETPLVARPLVGAALLTGAAFVELDAGPREGAERLEMRGLFLWIDVRLPVSDPDLMRDVADRADAVAGQNLDVKAAGVNPLLHYVTHGAAEGRDPSPRFRTRPYLRQHPEALTSGLDPLSHSLLKGD